MERTAKEAGVHIVSGDTKVAGKGQVDGVIYHNNEEWDRLKMELKSAASLAETR